ncbi:uncharacterized protein LOC119276037 isoform X2 [Triticum dicoccoides]|uniref:uncharacterized protein LOC119276037 isoform X2 n=1 Tax=Triticum dicoccoides TaxID=85692 RepID=UPI00188DDAB0|nr:uncharacterized protein LOC119276037 isoform X2 [Triticum dicoccoides]
MRLLCGEPGRGPIGGAACRGCGVRRARRTDASATVLDEVVAATVMARRRDGEQQWPLVPVQEIRKRHPPIHLAMLTCSDEAMHYVVQKMQRSCREEPGRGERRCADARHCLLSRSGLQR